MNPFSVKWDQRNPLSFSKKGTKNSPTYFYKNKDKVFIGMMF